MVTVPPSPPRPVTPDFSWSYALDLPYDPRAARIARRTLRVVLTEHGMNEITDSAELLASELVGNAYQHAEGPSGLRLRPLGSGRLRLSVWDTNPYIPPPFDRRRPAGGHPLVPVGAESGRGLFLVCQYADDWGGWPLGGDHLFGRSGKLLWCELGAGSSPSGCSVWPGPEGGHRESTHDAQSSRPYRAGTMADLSGWISRAEERERWRMVAEFLEEYRHEPPGERLSLLAEEPPPTGDEHWDAFLGGFAEHLAAKEGRAAPAWSEARILPRFWFPFNTPAARVDAFVHAPAAFRRRGVFVAATELEVA